MNELDKQFKRIAREYAERYGQALDTERAQLEQDGAPHPTETLERRVMQSVRGNKLLRYQRAFAAVAAVFVLVVVGMQVWRFMDGPASNAPNTAAEATAPCYEVIPLAFSVPDGFTQTAFRQDYAKSVYSFADIMLDDVVLSMEASTKPLDTAGLTAIQINGAAAYVSDDQGFCLLTFYQNGVLYELTCRYDINTLLRFGAEIL